MQRYESMTHILRDACERDRHIRFIDGEKEESAVSFGEIWERAVDLLGFLQARGMELGDELVIFTRSNERFVIAFWAAILGGMVPVPVAVGISDEHRFKLFRILRQLRRGTLYTEAGLRDRLIEFADQHDAHDVRAVLQTGSIVDEDIVGGRPGEVAEPAPGNTAFIQYSSGSTSDPKGVCLTHLNLTTNIRAIIESTTWTADDQSLSWMPLTHDMGLIGYHLSTLTAGMNHAIMDTSLFIRRPLMWMQKASELRASQLCSPNFGYKHFLKLFERKGLDDLDLSSVKLIVNGAEPISWDLCETFLAALAPYGLRRETMYPVYGLAEATLAVSFPTVGKEYSRIIADRHSLKIGEPYVSLDEDDADTVSFVKVGQAIRDVRIRITDDEDRTVADGIVGHIQVHGDSVASGLYDDPATEATLFAEDHWLRTGDCGVIVDGELVITGRSKDIIIINGQNYYPHDIEDIVARVDGLDIGKVVVCGVNTTAAQTEELLVFVLFRQDVESFRPVARAVHEQVGEHIGIEVDHVIPVTRIPKTTSGKLQRSQLGNAYLDGEFDELVSELSGAPQGAEDLDDDPLVRELELICREFSKERRIGPDDNLFEVGVSSLTLTEIVLAVDEKYPGKLDISDLFDYPTLRELADFMRR